MSADASANPPRYPEHLKFTLEGLDRRFSTEFRLPQIRDSEDVQLIADAIRRHGRLTHTTLSGQNLSHGETNMLLSALAGCKSLRYLRIDRTTLLEREAHAVASLIRNNPHLQYVLLDDCGLREKGAEAISEALSDSQSLRELSFTGNAIGDAGGKAVASLVQNCPNLLSINLVGCEIRDTGLQALTTALQGNTQLANIALQQNHCSAETSQTLGDTLLANGSPNLVKARLPSEHAALSEACRHNQTEAEKASERLEDYFTAADSENNIEQEHHFSEMPAAAIAQVYQRLPAVRYIEGSDASEYFEEMLESAEVEPSEALSLESLTKRTYDGISPLEHPGNWKQFEHLAQTLAQQGTPITREFLEQKNPKGESYLQIGLTHAPYEVLPVLNEMGIHIGKDELLPQASGNPAPLYTALAEQGNLQAAFTLKNWEKSPKEMRPTYNALPESDRTQVRDIFQLSALMRQQGNEKERGR
jgi:hypothetical protein